MAVKNVADSLVSFCREGKFLEAVDALYSDGIVSIEPVGSEEMPAEIQGKAKVRGKSEWWLANHEVHRIEVTGPYVGEDQFAIHLFTDVTFKPANQRMTMTEMCLYTVEGDQIVKEQFFYNAPNP